MQQKRHLNLESKNTWAISCDEELAGVIGDLKGTQHGDWSIQGKWRREWIRMEPVQEGRESHLMKEIWHPI